MHIPDKPHPKPKMAAPPSDLASSFSVGRAKFSVITGLYLLRMKVKVIALMIIGVAMKNRKLGSHPLEIVKNPRILEILSMPDTINPKPKIIPRPNVIK